MSERIVIIDGNSLINRAYYAMQKPMITKDGIYTQGIFGFVNMLNKIIGDYEPMYLTVAFDLKAPTFRHLEYEGYKAQRKGMPEELAMQMLPLKQVLKEQGLDIEELAAAAYEIGRPLPWQHLDMGFTEAYLISEWRKAQREEFTPMCFDLCRRCGVCGEAQV